MRNIKKIFLRCTIILGIVLGFNFFNSLFSDNTVVAIEGFEVRNCHDLQDIRNNPAANYKLANDIDCTDTINWDSGQGFEPIGTFNQPFTGVLYGRNHRIIGLYINRPNDEYVGLFGYIQKANVKNLKIIQIHVVGKTFVGGVAASSSASKFLNVFVDGEIIGNLNKADTMSIAVGGLIGRSDNDGVIRSSTNVVVKGGIHTGGLIGEFNNSGEMNKSFSFGSLEFNNVNINWSDLAVLDLQGTNGICTGSPTIGINWDDSNNVEGICAGGLIGETKDSKIKNSYSLVHTTFLEFKEDIKFILGNLIGVVKQSNVQGSYSTGEVIARNFNHVKGFVAKDKEYFGPKTSYWNQDISGFDGFPSNVGTPKTTAEMKTAGLLGGATWTYCDGQDYPRLTIENKQCLPFSLTQSSQITFSRFFGFYPNPSYDLSYAISDDTIVIGFPFGPSIQDNGGIVRVYKKQLDNSWQERTPSLTPTDIHQYDRFGSSVYLDGDRLFVMNDRSYGGHGDSTLYIYQNMNQNGTESWVEIQRNTFPINSYIRGKNVFLGRDMFIKGNFYKLNGSDIPSFYTSTLEVYTRDANQWTLTQTITPDPNLMISSQSQVVMSRDRNKLAVYFSPPNGSNVIYTYQRNQQGNFDATGKINLVKLPRYLNPPLNETSADNYTVNIENDVLVVGQVRKRVVAGGFFLTYPTEGAVLVYRYNGVSWELEDTLINDTETNLQVLDFENYSGESFYLDERAPYSLMVLGDIIAYKQNSLDYDIGGRGQELQKKIVFFKQKSDSSGWQKVYDFSYQGFSKSIFGINNTILMENDQGIGIFNIKHSFSNPTAAASVKKPQPVPSKALAPVIPVKPLPSDKVLKKR